MKKEKEVVKKKRFNFVKFLIVLLLLYVLGFYTYKILVSKINNIFITNNKILTDQEIIDSAGLRDYPSFLLTPKIKIKKQLLKNKLIKDVNIKKKIGKIVEIEVIENEPLFIYKNEVILDNGEKLDNVNYILPSLINNVSPEILKKLINKYKDLNQEIKSMISEIKYDPNDIDKERFLLTMNDGNYVYITLYKLISLNEYIKIVDTIGNKKGTLYLDSGNYFEVFKNS